MDKNKLTNGADNRPVHVTFVERVGFLSAQPAMLGDTPTVTVSVQRPHKGHLISDNLSLTHDDAMRMILCMAEALAATGDARAVCMLGAVTLVDDDNDQMGPMHQLEQPDTDSDLPDE